MSIKINLGAWSSVFAVPSKIVDEGLKFSDGVKLKVLLYVLRNSGNKITDSDISAATGVNVTDIPEALDYWVSMGILQKSENEYKPVQVGAEEKEKAEKMFDHLEPVDGGIAGEFGFITDKMTEKAFNDTIAEFDSFITRIRVGF